jgi:hypothetical protein
MKQIAIAIAFATVSTTAFATSQTDVVDANNSEHFKVECKTNDGTIVHLVVRNGELDPATHEIKTHKIFARNKQYALHTNSWKKASNVYVWSARDGAGNTVDGEMANLGPDFGWHYREIINDRVVVNADSDLFRPGIPT